MVFDWDDGNLSKTLKHGLTHAEIESAFRDSDLYFDPAKQVDEELRYLCIGTSNLDRLCTIIFC